MTGITRRSISAAIATAFAAAPIAASAKAPALSGKDRIRAAMAELEAAVRAYYPGAGIETRFIAKSHEDLLIGDLAIFTYVGRPSP